MWMLEWIKLLDDLSTEELAQLEVFCQQKFLKKGEILFEEWQEANAMYLLIDWKIEIYKKKWIKNITLGVLEPEEILGEMAVFGSDWIRMAWAKAKEDTILITILTFSMKGLTEKHPLIMQKIQELIEKRMYENKMKGA